MGLFGIDLPNPLDGIGKAWDATTHFVGDAWNATTTWVGDNWKTLAAVGISAVAFVGIVGLCAVCPFAIPGVIALVAAGFGSGVTFYGVNQLLNGQPLSWADALVQGGLSAVITLATAGVGELAAPVISRVAAPVVSSVLPEVADTAIPTIVTKTLTNTTAGAVFGAGTKVVENALTGKPLGDGVGDATLLGGVSGLLVEPANRIVGATGLPVAGTSGTEPPTKTEPVPPKAEEPPVAAVPAEAPKGAGGTSYGKPPGLGGVEPLSPIEGQDRAYLDQWTDYTNGFRKPGPLVLTDEQLAALEQGRMGPSNTIKSGDTTAVANFRSAAKQVNDYVASGEDLSIEKIQEINRTLLQGSSNDPYAGVLRSQSGQDVGHRTGDGGFYYYAANDDVNAYLNDFMAWYKANENVLPPTELAAEAYQQLVRIHPFVDSNGRTTRLVMDWILQRNGLPPGVYTTVSSEAVHSSTAAVVYNTAQATTAAQNILTTTVDTSAQAGVTIQVAPPSSSKGVVGALGDAH